MAIEINPQDDLSNNQKGETLAVQQNYVQAIECYDKAIEINPQNTRLYENKGDTRRKQKRYSEAI